MAEGKNINKNVDQNKAAMTGNGVEGDYQEHVRFHLKELRNRLIIIIFAMVLCTMIAYPFTENILHYVWNLLLGNSIGMNVYSPMEWVFARIKISLLIAGAFTLPFAFYELFRFSARGLYPNEKKFIISIVPVSFLFFLIGAAFAFRLLAPVMVNYIILSADNLAENQISVKQTISMIVTLMAGTGLAFQIPLLMAFATRMGIVQRKTLKKMRFLVYASLLTFAMFLSPDPTFIAQLVCAALLVVLFEIGLLVSK